MKKLPKEFKEKWVKALRSGEYKKGICSLFIPEKQSYCCLGVAGKLRKLSLKSMANKNNADDPIYTKAMPYLDRSDIDTLTGMNDCERYSFSEIADYIEANL